MSSNCRDTEGCGEKHTEVCCQENLGLALLAELRRNIMCFFCNEKQIILPVESDLPGKTGKLSVHNHKRAPKCNVCTFIAVQIFNFGIQLHLKLLRISLDANFCCIIFSTCLLYIFHWRLHIMFQYLFYL